MEPDSLAGLWAEVRDPICERLLDGGDNCQAIATDWDEHSGAHLCRRCHFYVRAIRKKCPFVSL